jgi:hypothetical protein
MNGLIRGGGQHGNECLSHKQFLVRFPKINFLVSTHFRVDRIGMGLSGLPRLRIRQCTPKAPLTWKAICSVFLSMLRIAPPIADISVKIPNENWIRLVALTARGDSNYKKKRSLLKFFNEGL